MLTAKEKFQRRANRVRIHISGTNEVPRLCLKKSLKHLYAQVIDDTSLKTLAFLSTRPNLQKDDFKELKSKKSKDAAVKFGAAVGKKLVALGIKKVVFDTRGYKYHGVVKTFADAVRSAGVEF